jgi:hypothetical protein
LIDVKENTLNERVVILEEKGKKHNLAMKSDSFSISWQIYYLL